MTKPLHDHPAGGHGPMLEGGGTDRMGEMMGFCLQHADELGLSPEQITRLTPLHREMEKKQVRFRADLKIAEMDLRDIMEVKDFDLTKASAAVNQIATIKSSHQLEMLKALKEVRAVLSEDQFRQMKKIMPMEKRMTNKAMKPARK
jgi:Spy/CpxP family protein refolding chaperone